MSWKLPKGGGLVQSSESEEDADDEDDEGFDWKRKPRVPKQGGGHENNWRNMSQKTFRYLPWRRGCWGGSTRPGQRRLLGWSSIFALSSQRPKREGRAQKRGSSAKVPRGRIFWSSCGPKCKRQGRTTQTKLKIWRCLAKLRGVVRQNQQLRNEAVRSKTQSEGARVRVGPRNEGARQFEEL
jgi:hypothetical protein